MIECSIFSKIYCLIENYIQIRQKQFCNTHKNLNLTQKIVENLLQSPENSRIRIKKRNKNKNNLYFGRKKYNFTVSWSWKIQTETKTTKFKR